MLNRILYGVFGNVPFVVRAAKLSILVGAGAAAAYLSTEIQTGEGIPETTAAITLIVLGAVEKFANSRTS